MVSKLSFALALAIALGGAGCDRQADEAQAPAAKAPVETPKRKAGLWRQEITLGGVPTPQAVLLCLDEASDRQISWWSQQGVRSDCQKNEVSRQADGSWRFDSICNLGPGGATSTNGVATGDFQQSYRVEAQTTTSGSSIPQHNGMRAVTIDATWQGECPAGMIPGDIELENGLRMNVLKLQGDEGQ